MTLPVALAMVAAVGAALLRLFAMMHAWHLQYWTRCHRCGQRFSDWFVWDDGRRFCFLCWSDSNYETVIREGVKP